MPCPSIPSALQVFRSKYMYLQYAPAQKAYIWRSRLTSSLMASSHCLVAAPHCLDKARLLICDLLEFILVSWLHRYGSLCVFLHALTYHAASCPAALLPSLPAHRCAAVIFSLVSLRTITAMTCFDILRSELDTNRNSAHLLLGEFPSRALVRIVQLHAQSGSFCKRLFDLICLFQNALLLLTESELP